MSPILAYIVMVLAQISQAVFRVWNIRCLAAGSKWKSHISMFLYTVTWLVGISIGLDSVKDLDFLGITLFVLGGLVGQEIGMRIKR